jgi:hypothetical protein
MLIYPNNDLISEGYSPHAEYSGFIEPKAFDRLLLEFPPASLFKIEEPEYRKNNQRPHWRQLMCYSDKSLFVKYKNLAQYFVDISSLPEIWQELVESIVRGKEYREWVGNTLKIKDFDIRLDWHRTRSGLDASPHVDSIGKLGSHLFYFMPNGWKDEFGGRTVFYKNKKTKKANPELCDFEESLEIPVVGNRSMIFKNVPEGWHGVTQVNLETNSDDNILHRQILNVVLLRRDI